jgi:hypothetical protein
MSHPLQKAYRRPGRRFKVTGDNMFDLVLQSAPEAFCGLILVKIDIIIAVSVQQGKPTDRRR